MSKDCWKKSFCEPNKPCIDDCPFAEKDPPIGVRIGYNCINYESLCKSLYKPVTCHCDRWEAKSK